MSDLFSGKVVLVTGGSAGIGRAAALLFARHDARVIVSDINAGGGQVVVSEIKSSCGDAAYVNCDVSSRDDVRALVARTIEIFGRLDCAFNNAGIILDADTEWDDAAFEKTMAINVFGVMQCMKAEIPEMLKVGGGTIVNTASINGIIASGMPSQPAYTASKHAVIGLTKTAALTYARRNIRVNALCPGVTHTPMVDRVARLGPEVKEKLDNFSPIGRMARPEEIAEAAIWLCSEKSSFVTGHALIVDGGAVVQ
jgi:NAD(P)-dependent dehydrogenase (short-subunit alcohol dehydrogenase family)